MRVLLVTAAFATSCRSTLASDRTPESVTNNVLDAVSALWASPDTATAQLVETGTPLLVSGLVSSGTLQLPALNWSGETPDNTYVRCNPCSMDASRTLQYSVAVGDDGELEYLSVLLNTTGSLDIEFDATLPQPVNGNTSMILPPIPHRESVTSVAYEEVTLESADGATWTIGVSADIESVLLAVPVRNHVDPVAGIIEANVEIHSGFVYTPSTGIQPFADQAATYFGNNFDVVNDNNLVYSHGFAAHVAIDVVQNLQIVDVAAVSSRVSTAMQIFSAPGSDVLYGADVLEGQTALCLFDGDCPADEICASTGSCFSYTRTGASHYCDSYKCGSGDPGCNVLGNETQCTNGGTCNTENCRIFHTHGDNLEKYNAVCCGEDADDEGQIQTCEFEQVEHLFWATDIDILSINDVDEDTSPLLRGIANIEGITCGMGDPTRCVRVDGIHPAPGGFGVGFIATATVARNCGVMELYVMSVYDCFDECVGVGSLPGLFHSTSGARRRLSSPQLRHENGNVGVERRQLQGVLDPIASDCPESNVVSFATDISISVDLGAARSVNEAEVWSHVEPVDAGCVANQLAGSSDIQDLVMPVIVQVGSTWAGDIRYVGDATDQGNGNSMCSDTFGFDAGEWADGSAFARVNMQVVNTTEMMSLLPTFHTKFLFTWGALPQPGDSGSSPFSCNVDAQVDLGLDLRVAAVWAIEPNPSNAVRRECRFADERTIKPPAISFVGTVSRGADGNTLNLTDTSMCWQASLTPVGNTPLSQGDCSCPVGQKRYDCNKNGEDVPTVCEACAALPDHHYYTSDGGNFWNGCAFEACKDDCGVGRYRKGCSGTSPGFCEDCISGSSIAGFLNFTDDGGFEDNCEAQYAVEEKPEVTTGPPQLTGGEVAAIAVGILVVASLTVMAVFIVQKKRQDRLNDVHKAMQLTSKSQLKASTVIDEHDGYDSFHGDIVID